MIPLQIWNVLRPWCVLLLALLFATNPVSALAQSGGVAVAKPKDLEPFSQDEVDAYCAAALGSLARTAIKVDNGDVLSFEFFTAQALLVYGVTARGVPPEIIKPMVDRYYSASIDRKPALAYCRQLGQIAYERATQEQRKRAGDRAYSEIKKLEKSAQR